MVSFKDFLNIYKNENTKIVNEGGKMKTFNWNKDLKTVVEGNFYSLVLGKNSVVFTKKAWDQLLDYPKTKIVPDYQDGNHSDFQHRLKFTFNGRVLVVDDFSTDNKLVFDFSEKDRFLVRFGYNWSSNFDLKLLKDLKKL